MTPDAGSHLVRRSFRTTRRPLESVPRDIDVVVVAGVGFPRAVGSRVERPVRNVETTNRVHERRPGEFSRCEPLAAPPAPDVVTDATGVDTKRQKSGWADRRLDLLVVNERRRTAELTVLAHTGRVEDHHRAATLTFDGTTLYLPSAHLVGQLAQGCHEIQFDHLAGLAVDPIRRLRAAERTDQLLLGWAPFGLRATGRAGMFLERRNLRGHRGVWARNRVALLLRLHVVGERRS